MIFNEISSTEDKLKELLDVLKESGIKLAESERQYRICKAKKELELRKSGMPITLIPDLTKGDTEASKLAYERDCQEVIYKHAQESINVYKKELDILKMYFEKEYSNDTN